VESSDSDFALAKRVSKGDTSAFRTIVEKYKDMSLSLACSILKNEEEAEDVLQEAFLKVFKNIGKFRFNSKFSTWLYRIVVNTCLNAKEKSKDHLHTEIENTELMVQEDTSGFGSLMESERANYIAEAFNLMKQEEALLLRLYYLCDLSIDEIKKVTDLSESNIKVTLHRGRKNMYTILERRMGNELKSLL
jgi:RNA polymerase sigma-70 factor (ECF subfamily)